MHCSIQDTRDWFKSAEWHCFLACAETDAQLMNLSSHRSRAQDAKSLQNPASGPQKSSHHYITASRIESREAEQSSERSKRTGNNRYSEHVSIWGRSPGPKLKRHSDKGSRIGKLQASNSAILFSRLRQPDRYPCKRTPYPVAGEAESTHQNRGSRA